MSRLPSPGGDDNQWGAILNDFLATEHNPDGSQKPLPQSKVINLTTDLAAKVPATRTVSGHALTSDISLVKADVGLGNVDNTSDLNKPISTATQTAINADRARLDLIESAYVVAPVPTGVAATDGPALQALINSTSAGVIHLRPGTYRIDTSLDMRNKSNITIQGAGMDATTVACTAALNGSDSNTKNSVFNANNLTVPFGSYLRNLTFSDMTIDCTLQNASGVPVGAVFGYNLCAVECQNVDNAHFSRLRIVKAFGNGLASASIDPGTSTAVEGAIIEDCLFEGCVRGILPQYGIAGSVIQFGAMNGGEITRCAFLDSGGPAVDAFNCIGTRIHHNYLRGVNSTTIGSGQTMNSIRSDFGLVACSIDHNVFDSAGIIQLNGIMTPNALNDNTGTPGPKDCTIDYNLIAGTGSTALTAPSIPASTGTVANSFGAPALITVNGGTGISLLVDGVVQNGSGESGRQYLAPTGSTVRLDYSSAPTWDWRRAPNAVLAAIGLQAGNSTGQTLGVCESNHIAHNTISAAPSAAIQLYDARRCDISDNIIRNCAEWQGGDPAIQALDSNVVAGGGTQACSFVNNSISDSRTTPRMGASFQSDTANNVDNSFLSNRIGPTTGLQSPVSRLQYRWEDNYTGSLLVRAAIPSVAAAGTLSLPDIGAEMFTVTGNTSVTGIFANTPGRLVTLSFASNPLVFDTGNIMLAGNFQAAAGSTLSLVCDGTNWIEIARSLN